MQRLLLCPVALLTSVLTFSLLSATETPLDKAACPVTGKPVDSQIHAAYKSARVYFVDVAARDEFEQSQLKFAAKANHQLVVTGQAHQVRCPLTGDEPDGEQTVEIAGATVAFRSRGYQRRITDADETKRLAIVFNDRAFAKGFEVNDKDKATAQERNSGQPTEQEIARGIEVQERHTAQLMRIEGVHGTAVGLDAQGRVAVKVYAEQAGVKVPAELEGVPVSVEVTGKIKSLQRFGRGKLPDNRPKKPRTPKTPPDDPVTPPDPPPSPPSPPLPPTPPSNPAPPTTPPAAPKVDPRGRFERPVPIGVSTGNITSCSSGTISCRVKKNGQVYALSNNHVMALTNSSADGTAIVQPGKADTGCRTLSGDQIGTLEEFKLIFFGGTTNVVDAALARVTPEKVGNSTPSDGYGTPSSTIKDAKLGDQVQKYGRTSGLTRGTVNGINATVLVDYGSGTATFAKQVIVRGTGRTFLQAGDSGSLLVTDPGKNPCGLLFAGGDDIAVANPIRDVLSTFGVTVDGD